MYLYLYFMYKLVYLYATVIDTQVRLLIKTYFQCRVACYGESEKNCFDEKNK